MRAESGPPVGFMRPGRVLFPKYVLTFSSCLPKAENLVCKGGGMLDEKCVLSVQSICSFDFTRHKINGLETFGVSVTP
jgi:hypothetical protein